MTNDKICPETPLRVLLPACEIPDTANVTKRTGENVYTLAHNLKVYGTPNAEQPLVIEGYFLVGPRGSINQVPADRLLHWNTTAEELVDIIRQSWETEQ